MTLGLNSNSWWNPRKCKFIFVVETCKGNMQNDYNHICVVCFTFEIRDKARVFILNMLTFNIPQFNSISALAQDTIRFKSKD